MSDLYHVPNHEHFRRLSRAFQVMADLIHSRQIFRSLSTHEKLGELMQEAADSAMTLGARNEAYENRMAREGKEVPNESDAV